MAASKKFEGQLTLFDTGTPPDTRKLSEDRSCIVYAASGCVMAQDSNGSTITLTKSQTRIDCMHIRVDERSDTLMDYALPITNFFFTKAGLLAFLNEAVQL